MKSKKHKIEINPELNLSAEKEQLKIVIVGHVDHGKSTLIGRLFYDTNSLPEGKFEQIKASCDNRGMVFEYSFLLDALQAERDQGITIDTTQLWLKTESRNYVIIDAPGHKEFLKNMISGAAQSEAAILVIDVKEGVKEQSKRHGYLLSLLGVDQVIVAVNKMDMVAYSEMEFKKIEKEYAAYLKSIGVTANYIIPISGREGDNIKSASANTKWYKGPTIISALSEFKPAQSLENLPLRLPVQDVYKFDERRIIAGKIESGKISVGDEILFSPSNKIVKISSIENWPANKNNKYAISGESVGITLSEQIFAERGQVISHIENAPTLTNSFLGKIFWLGEKPLQEGDKFIIKINTAQYQAEVKKIKKVINTDDLQFSENETQVGKAAVAEIIFRIKGIMPLDKYSNNPTTGRFVIIDNYRIVGGGIIDFNSGAKIKNSQPKSKNLFPSENNINAQMRAQLNGHKGGVLWLTGLSASGKSTLAYALQSKLFEKGYQVYVLDGDNIRTGLNKDLGFNPEDRSENIRRVGEVASLFAQAGVICITAFISPYKDDRAKALIAAGENYHSIYIKADIETCKKRDPKGLYKKAASGEIKEFTGVSAPFEEPDDADLVIDTAKLSIEDSVAELLKYVQKNLVV